MKAVGAFIIPLAGSIVDKTLPEGNVVESSTFADTIAADVAQDESSFAGALAGTAQLITGWIVVLIALLAFGLCAMPKKKRTYRRTRRKTTTRKRRTYRKRK